QAFAIELPHNSENTPADLGLRFAEVLEKAGAQRAETLVALGRSNIELRSFNVPPVPDDELPDLVRLQAPRHFTTIDDDWALDFFTLDEEAGDSRTVLAAAVASETIEQIRRTCDAAQCQLNSLVLRSCAAAALVKRAEPSSAGVRLLIDPLAEDVDLTVLSGDTVVFTRTTRLTAEVGSDMRADALLGEIRRTILAARNQLQGRQVERVVLCGAGDDHTAIELRIAEQLGLPVERFDPFSVCTLARPLRRALPPHPGRFAPLLGLLLSEASGTRHAIDFLNPRRRPAPPDQRRLYGLAVGAAVSIAAVAGYLVWSNSADIDDRLKALQTKSARLEKQLNSARESQQDLAGLQQWQSGDINWVAELARTSKEFPPTSQAIVTHLLGSAQRDGGGQMRLDGYAADASTVISMERSLRDATHDVYGSGSQEDEKRTKYRWTFSERVEIQPVDHTATPPAAEPKP
ncbi:MAG: hypothetical protein KDA42_18735, partial [Planctomycetales bacterium]|nr:hypothetical protein [Planctomycetales bacterium]